MHIRAEFERISPRHYSETNKKHKHERNFVGNKLEITETGITNSTAASDFGGLNLNFSDNFGFRNSKKQIPRTPAIFGQSDLSR